jgi:hypothetical protein
MSALLLRLDTRDGLTKWRGFVSHDHATDHRALCQAFGLDPHRATFDLPSTARGVGSASGLTRRKGLINGFVFYPGQDEPIGVLTFAVAGERFPDVDPGDLRELFALRNRVG